MAKLTLSDLRAIRERGTEALKQRDVHGRTTHVVVAMGTSGIEKGAKVVLNTIAEEVAARHLDNVIITQTGPAKDAPEPLVEVYSPATGLVVYAPVDRETAVRIVSEHLENGKILSDKRIEIEKE